MVIRLCRRAKRIGGFMTVIYGIKNCDTMKKAMAWLNDNGVDYLFHDYKKDKVPANMIDKAINQFGWEVVINKRGTTWRTLDQEIKDTMDNKRALNIVIENPSIIKRPLLNYNEKIYLGFKENQYRHILKSSI